VDGLLKYASSSRSGTSKRSVKSIATRGFPQLDLISSVGSESTESGREFVEAEQTEGDSGYDAAAALLDVVAVLGLGVAFGISGVSGLCAGGKA